MTTFSATNSRGFAHHFEAENWDDAQVFADEMGLEDVGILCDVFDANEEVLFWAQERGVIQ